MTWGELRKLWWFYRRLSRSPRRDWRKQRRCWNARNKASVFQGFQYWTVSHSPTQVSTNGLLQGHRTGSRKSCVDLKLTTFSKEKKCTRGDTRWVAYPSSHPFGHNSIFFWYKSNTLSACRQLNELSSPSSFILRRGSKPLSEIIIAKLYFYHLFVPMLPFYG